MRIRVICIICLYIFFLGSVATSADESQEIVRAEIGIQIRSGDDEIRRATACEKVKVGDRLRVYVIPEPDPTYIYVIYSDQKIVIRLNKAGQHKIPKGFILKLPSDEGSYQINGESSLEYVTVICSPEQLTELESFLKTEDLSYEKWLEIEQKLIERSQIDLRDQVSKPIDIAGSIQRSDDPFLEELQIFSGKSLVVRKYEFRVKE